jgi:hypothetical protein
MSQPGTRGVYASLKGSTTPFLQAATVLLRLTPGQCKRFIEPVDATRLVLTPEQRAERLATLPAGHDDQGCLASSDPIPADPLDPIHLVPPDVLQRPEVEDRRARGPDGPRSLGGRDDIEGVAATGAPRVVFAREADDEELRGFERALLGDEQLVAQPGYLRE